VASNELAHDAERTSEMITDQLIREAKTAIRRGEMALAEALLRQIRAIDSQNLWALNMLGGVLAEQGMVEAAVEALGESLLLQPDDPETLANRAALLYRLNREEEGITLGRRSIALRPGDARTHMILAEALLRRGEFAEGWAEYEWRLHMPGYEQIGRTNLSQPQWHGEDVSGRTILIHAEQGLGDIILMTRYVPLLASRGARVIVECEAPLRSLLWRVEGAADVVARGTPLPAFDLHCPIMSLPRAFGTMLATVPANVPYLRPERQSASRSDGFTIGIAWAGGPRAARRRSPPALFERLMQIAGVRWVSLQMAGAYVEPLTAPDGAIFTDPTSKLRDLADTASLVAQLDLVISVDTVVAHLAGATGKPVWTLLTYAADWRWLRDRTDSPWYPTMRLFRQKSRGDWDGVASDVSEALIQQLGLER
jgi:hypothetical protein